MPTRFPCTRWLALAAVLALLISRAAYAHGGDAFRGPVGPVPPGLGGPYRPPSKRTPKRGRAERVSVDVIELMPPAVHTALTTDLPDDAGFKIMTLDQLVAATFTGLKKGREEIRPGQANQLRMMSRMAPGFIGKQLEQGSAALVPPVG